MKLHASQTAALETIRQYASSRQAAARSLVDHVLRMSNVPQSDYDLAMSAIRHHARVGLHFHPDRLNQNMDTVADSLLAEGFYRNQFETFLSSGKLSPEEGGDRALWEDDLFGGAYRGAPPAERPKYGALNLMLLPDGPCPRFGSSYFLLKPEVSRRCTFTYMDSHNNPPEKGTLDAFDDIFAALLAESFQKDFALGEANIRPRELMEHMKNRLGEPFEDPSSKSPARNLDHYIEAQVHGAIHLEDDVDILVADPSFKETETGSSLERICKRFDIDLYWHCGFMIEAEDVPSDFRGPTMPSLSFDDYWNRKGTQNIIYPQSAHFLERIIVITGFLRSESLLFRVSVSSFRLGIYRYHRNPAEINKCAPDLRVKAGKNCYVPFLFQN